jgi:purine-nucleoside phosphorylase
MAESFLENVVCFNEIRGMLGYTGNFKGKRVSLMGTGMGIPSTAIYLHELITEFGVRRVVRAGTAGALTEDIQLGEMILAISASTDSGFNKTTFNKKKNLFT